MVKLQYIICVYAFTYEKGHYSYLCIIYMYSCIYTCSCHLLAEVSSSYNSIFSLSMNEEKMGLLGSSVVESSRGSSVTRSSLGSSRESSVTRFSLGSSVIGSSSGTSVIGSSRESSVIGSFLESWVL